MEEEIIDFYCYGMDLQQKIINTILTILEYFLFLYKLWLNPDPMPMND